jgi:hypothetical protein
MTVEYPDLQPFYERVFKDALSDSDISKEIEFARGFFEDWAGNFLHPLGNDFGGRRGRLNSILYSYLASQSLTFDWLSHSLIFGHYLSVLRELRTILENLFYMYSLDVKFANKTVDEKYKILADLEAKGKEPYGKVVFEKSGYVDWKIGYDLYKDLSRYIHIHTSASAKLALEVAKNGFKEALDIKYRRQSFIECAKAWRKVATLALSLAVDLSQQRNITLSETDVCFLERAWKNEP